MINSVSVVNDKFSKNHFPIGSPGLIQSIFTILIKVYYLLLDSV